MFIDGALQFSGTAGVAGSPDSPTTGTQVSNNVIDFLNARDMGIGDDPALKVLAEVTVAFTGGTSLQVNYQTSPDNSTWTTAVSGPVIAEANLTVGAYLLSIDVPRPAAGLAAIPRYARLQYVTVGTHGAGSLFASIVLDREDLPTLLAYPPGLVIAN